MPMVEWGQRYTPFWPTLAELRTNRLQSDTAWLDGASYSDLLFEVLPLLRCYFLLGYRCADILVLDYTTVAADQSPPEGRRGFSLATGRPYSIDGVMPSDLTGLHLPTLDDLELHIVFQLEAINDISGGLGTDDPTAATRSARRYAHDNLEAHHRVISLVGGATALADLQAGVDEKVTQFYSMIQAHWVDTSTDTSKVTLARTVGGGMLWLFDPDHWGGLDGKFSQGRYPLKNLLKRLMPSNDNTGQFLLEQIFDVRLRGTEFFSGSSDDSVSQAAARRRAPDTLQNTDRPGLKYYNANPHRGGRPSVPTNNPPRIKSRDFFENTKALVDRHGKAHIWSYDRWKDYDAMPDESWLDTILALGWEGAIDIEDAVRARPPAEPYELKVTSKGRPGERWHLTLHQELALQFSWYSPPTDIIEDSKLDGRIAFEYIPGSEDRQTTLRIVAGRSISIATKIEPLPAAPQNGSFKSHYEAYFKEYAKKHPWRLEIYRVQDDAPIPPLGTAIEPARFQSPIHMNSSPPATPPITPTTPPSPDDPAPDFHTPLIMAQYPLNHRPGHTPTYDALIDLDVLITPTPFGERIQFPVTQVVDNSPLQSSLADKSLYEGIRSGGSSWEIFVNPFSGKAAYTYDLFMEQYEVGGFTVLNIHVVAIVSENTRNHVQIRTSLSPGRSYFETFWDTFLNVDDTDPPDRPGYFSFDGIELLMDSTAEFWKIRDNDIHKLPPPMRVKLPITEPAPGAAGFWIQQTNATDGPDRKSRLGQTGSRMPSGSDWTSVLIGSDSLEVRKLRNGEWHNSLVDDLLFLMIDLSMGTVPVMGDALDLAEFTYALLSGKDRWGRPVSNFDVMLMGIGVMLPFVSSRALTFGAAFADAGVGPVTRSLRIASGSPPPVDSWLRRIIPLAKDAAAGNAAAKDALKASSDEFLNLRRFTRHSKSSGPSHEQRLEDFAQGLMQNADAIEMRLAALAPDDPANYLSLLDVVNKAGDGFVFRNMQDDFNRASAAYAKENGGAVLEMDAYLKSHARYTGRAFGRAIMGDATMGVRAKSARNMSPTHAGRLARDGDDVPLSSISDTQLVNAVIRYLRDAAREGESMKMWGAGYGRLEAAYLTDVTTVATRAGFPLGDPSLIDADHALIVRLRQLMDDDTGAPAFLSDILVGQRVGVKSLPEDEIGARVGESLLMAMDQLIHFDEISELSDISRQLSAIEAGDLIWPMRKMMSDWVNGAGGVWEHALKAELRESVGVKNAARRINAGNVDPDSELVGAQVQVFSQGRLVARSGVGNQMGSDEVIYITRNGVTKAYDWQVKSSSSIDRVMGTAIDGLSTSGVPAVVRKTENGVTTWSVEGGSEMFRQIVKQRLRKAHYRGKHPAYQVAGNPPPPSGGVPVGDDWVLAGDRHVYVADSEQIVENLIDRLWQVVPKGKRTSIGPDELKALSPTDRRLVEKIYSDEIDAGWPNGIDLEDAQTFHDNFLQKRQNIAEEMANLVDGYEDWVPGLRDALEGIGGPGMRNSPNESFFFRWTEDDDIGRAIDFLAGGD